MTELDGIWVADDEYARMRAVIAAARAWAEGANSPEELERLEDALYIVVRAFDDGVVAYGFS